MKTKVDYIYYRWMAYSFVLETGISHVEQVGEWQAHATESFADLAYLDNELTQEEWDFMTKKKHGRLFQGSGLSDLQEPERKR